MSPLRTLTSALVASAALAAACAAETPLPRILILGDSISMGYTPPLERLLAGRNDLCAFAAPHLADWQIPVNVHFKPEGSDRLALEVARRTWQLLGRDPAELPVSVPAAKK